MRLIEPYAGLGAFSLRCLWEAAGSDPRMRWEPPVSRQGSKSGFVINEFRAFGLVRQKWGVVLLNDLDPVCHLFHMLYASCELRDLVARRLWSMVPCPECLPLEVKTALDGQLKPTPESCKRAHEQRWQGTALCPLCANTGVMDARQLWERIRKEPVPGDLVEACAGGLYLQGSQLGGKPVVIRPDTNMFQALRGDGRNSERVESFRPSGIGFDEGSIYTAHCAASRVSSLPSGMASLADLTARALFMQSRSFQLKPVSIAGGVWDEHGMKPEIDDYTRVRPTAPHEDSPRWTVAERVSLLPGPGGCHIGISRMDALAFVRGLVLGKDDVLVLDPPYEGTSGYQAQSCRADVLEIARMGHEAGALVLLHESVGLAKELGKGWHQRSASPLRGRASTFHAGGVEREFLTSNRASIWWPAEQSTMFGGGR